MKLKRLFQVLVLGGSTLVTATACGGDSSNPNPNNTPPPQSLLPDGGMPPTGYTGPLIW
jgi:hypothetical protein